MKLNAGCGTHYAHGWVNVDVWEDDTTTPDVIAKLNEPYPFDDGEAEAVYLGHVLEHIPWLRVSEFVADMARVAAKDAPILIVGPDVYRTIKLFAQGLQPWHIVEATLESQARHLLPPDRGRKVPGWFDLIPADSVEHHWNCHEERLASLLRSMGFDPISYSDVIPDNPDQTSWHDDRTGITWPVVGKHHWQFGLLIKGRGE